MSFNETYDEIRSDRARVALEENGGENTVSNSSPARQSSDFGHLLGVSRDPTHVQNQFQDGKPQEWKQVRAMMWKNWIIKKRKPCQTVCEIVLPLLLLSILSLGWLLSLDSVEDVDSKIYANDKSLYTNGIALAASITDCSQGETNVQDCLGLNSIQDILDFESPVPSPDLDSYIGLSRAVQSLLDENQDIADQLDRLSIADNRYGNLVYLGRLIFAPDNAQVRKLVNYLNATYTQFDSVFYSIEESEQKAVTIAQQTQSNQDRTWAVVVLRHLDLEGTIDYVIRMNYTTVPSTNIDYFRFSRTFNGEHRKYYFSGYLSIQSAINSYILENAISPRADGGSELRKRTHPIGIPFPTPQVIGFNTFYVAVGPLIGFFMCMSMLFPVSRLIKAIVEEKETRMKETLRILGLSDYAFNMSWILTYTVVFTLISFFATGLICGSFVSRSDPFLILVFLFTFIMTLLPFSFLVSIFFNRSKIAAIVGPVVLFAAVIPRYAFFRAERNQAVQGKILASILSPTAFAFGADLIIDYEGAQIGIQWENLYDDELPFGILLFALVFDFVLYGLLAWYFDKVLPSEYGSRMPWHFPISSPLRYYGFWPSITDATLVGDSVEEHPLIEKPPSFLQGHELVRLSHLRKVWESGFGHSRKRVVAVDNLSLSMYPGQIFAFLGHNGAGKSTTISMMTGLFPPSDGDAFICDHSVRREINQVRMNLGFCPQHNTLFDKLTVREHLQLIAALKGIPQEDVTQHISDKLLQVGLREKEGEFSMTLSGGMKRKLSLAIAFMGDPKVVFLDECTAGMDPYSRRSTWQMLRQNKAGRVIVLTTHFMDEADMLGDRIAIMANGKLKCLGSSLFLKSKIGIGYNLTMVSNTGQFDLNVLKETILNSVPDAKHLSSSAGETAFQLPIKSKHLFGDLFTQLDAQKERLGIAGYGVSQTTLEEVFLRIATYEEHDTAATATEETPDMSELKEEERVGIAMPAVDPFEDIDSDLVYKTPRFWDQFRILFWKRYVYAKRDLSGLFFEIVLPVILVALTLLVLTIEFDPAGPEMTLSIDLFRSFTTSGSRVDTEVPYSTPTADIATVSALNRTGIRLEGRDEKDSLGISEFLLDTYLTHGSTTRYGAFVFNDSIALGALANNTNITEAIITSALFENQFGIASGNETVFALSDAVDILEQNRDVFNVSVPETVSFLNTTLNLTALGINDSLLLQANDSVSLASAVENVTISSDELAALVSDALVSGTFIFPLQPYGVVNLDQGNVTLRPFVSVLHNVTSAHALVSTIASVTEATFRTVLDNNTARLRAAVHPLPLTDREQTQINAFLSLIAALFVLVPFCYLPAAFVIFIVKERAVKAKHLQMVSGASSNAFWTATYVWDMLNYTFVIAFVMLVFLSFDNAAFVGTVEKAVCTFCLILFYGFAVIPLSYLYSFAFKSHASAQVVISSLHFVFGFVLVIAAQIMENIDTTRTTNESLKPFYRFVPTYNLGEGLLYLSTSQLIELLTGDQQDPFSIDNVGKNLIYLATESILFFSLVLLTENEYLRLAASRAFEHMYMRFLSPSQQLVYSYASSIDDDEDDDVAEERRRIASGSSQSSVLVIKQLRKVFRSKVGKSPLVAVRNMSLSMNKGECFGFLGINGAGKTTTMSILTGDLSPTKGSASIDGFSILTQMDRVRQRIGYCPQFDPLLDLLTGREHLYLFARLRGVPEDSVMRLVHRMLQQIGLDMFGDKPAGTYSGGNKRKLSLGIALIGNPAVMFLDEPGTGCDPVSRRFMWDLISKAKKNRSVVLTTHSMEECEALCGRVGVMVSGALKCLGSLQHLKNKFGEGYHIDIKLKDYAHHNAMYAPGELESLVEHFLQEHFQGTRIEEEYPLFLKLLVPKSAASLSDLFSTIEQHKDMYCIEDYSVSQANMNQIFVSIAKSNQQQPESTHM